MPNMRIAAGILCFVLLAFVTWAQTRAVTDPGVITTRQVITPAGVPTVFDGRVYGVSFGEDASTIWVANANKLFHLDWRQNQSLEAIALNGLPGLQGIQFDRAANRPLLSVLRPAGTGPAHVALMDRGSVVAGDLGTYQAGAIAIAPELDSRGRRLAVVPLTANNQLAVIDLAKRELTGKAATGIAPFGAVVSQDGGIAFVTNWGGRVAKPGETTARTGGAPDQVVVDARGVASTGTVTRIDLGTLAVTNTIGVGLHPTAIVWDEPGERLYVANGNSDSVSVIDTARMAVAQTFAIAPFRAKAAGIAPTALALSTDRATLYAACGGINAIAVMEARTGVVRGLIPTAWYPNGLSISPDGKWIAVSALLGVGSGWRDSPGKRYVHANRGAVAVLPVPDATQLANYTSAVSRNNRMDLAGAIEEAAAAGPARNMMPVTARAGDPSAVEQVVFIIKENRTYDQVFGDIEKGNGDKSLVMFGKDVTPNQHKLAEQFVLLDNFYATGGNSADGHQWLTQANEVDYCMWPGYEGRSYPFNGTDPIAYSKNGFLWDYALARGRTVRVYGEYAGFTPAPLTDRQKLLQRWQAGDDFAHDWDTKAPIAPLNNILAKNYPAWSINIPDVARARIFLGDLKSMEVAGSMPNLTVMHLPSNHTNGTTPGSSTPRAMVADNDLALGQVVEALTKSRFWPKMAVFVVEDDAQNGVDHVDGHRTVALAISPYVRRGYVDSTFYSTQSMVKTIELMLGLPTMSIFDLIAEDMRASFQGTLDLTPYSAVMPEVSLFDVNPPVKVLKGSARDAAVASAHMRFDIPDAAPAEKLNRILWHTVRGWQTPYPGAMHAVFAPLTLDLDDDEREKKR
jgi:YVTN family beta-propeller protein